MPLPTRFRVGRRDPLTQRLVFAFWLERPEKGGLRITGIVSRPNEVERRALFSHFGVAAQVKTGGVEGGMLVTRAVVEEPGTIEHFADKARALPAPFSLMAATYERFLR